MKMRDVIGRFRGFSSRLGPSLARRGITWRRSWPVLLIACVAFGSFFAFYLRSLYHQLDANFHNEEEFVPTRIYSDLFRVSAPIERDQLLTRLRNLNYRTTPVAGHDLEITLRAIDYPLELLPADHPTKSVAGKKIRFVFADAKGTTPLDSIQADVNGATEVETEIYLEPQLVTTFGKTDASGKREIRKILGFDEIPATVWQAIIAVEDPRFLEHKGIDPRGIARALWIDLRTGSLAQGGSTLTAQLVKNLMARHTRNVFRKFNELFLALLLEIRYSKEEILTRYLNEVYLGSAAGYEIHGVSEGAELFFGKDLNELNVGEIALMAGLIRGPAYYSPYSHLARAKERQRFVLKRMVEAGFLSEAEIAATAALPLRIVPAQGASARAPYFADYVKAELLKKLKEAGSNVDITSAGFRVYTTLDPVLNDAAQTAVARGVAQVETLYPGENLEGALASVDQKTGYIRALIGGRDYGKSTFNRVLNMKRQVGSTFKPFVYLAAFLAGKDEHGVPYSTGYPVEDAAWTLTFDQGRQTWTPKNYDKDFNGWIPLRLGLAKSLNTVTSRLGMQIGVPAIIEAARLAGIESDLPAVPSISLGVAELSPVELLSAYATIANLGTQDQLTVIRAITEPSGNLFARFVFEPKELVPRPAAALLAKTLQSTFTEGTALSAARGYKFDVPAAGKTGTTSSYRDAWFAGFTANLTTVVWVGADSDRKPSPQELAPPKPGEHRKKPKALQITGAGSALPIWIDFMKHAQRGIARADLDLGTELEEKTIDPRTGQLLRGDCPPSRGTPAYFMKGEEPSESTCENNFPPSIPALAR